MDKLAPVSWREMVRRFKNLGFDGPYQGGKHPYLVKGDLVLTLSNPHRGEIGIDLLARILKRAEVTRDEWIKAG